MNTERKICTNCFVDKPNEEYYLKKGGKNGRHAQCIECLRKKMRDYNKKHPNRNKILLMFNREKMKGKFKDFKITRTRFGKIERSLQGFEKYAESRMKSLSRALFNHALHLGIVTKPSCCSMCKEETIIEAHHNNYCKPLQTAWVCIPCHKRFHSR